MFFRPQKKKIYISDLINTYTKIYLDKSPVFTIRQLCRESGFVLNQDVVRELYIIHVLLLGIPIFNFLDSRNISRLHGDYYEMSIDQIRSIPGSNFDIEKILNERSEYYYESILALDEDGGLSLSKNFFELVESKQNFTNDKVATVLNLLMPSFFIPMLVLAKDYLELVDNRFELIV